MKKYWFFFLLLTAIGYWGCQKEVSAELGTSPDNDSTGTGGVVISGYGWSFTGNGSDAYRGCIDTAYYETANGVEILSVLGTDSAGNGFSVLIASPSGTPTPGTYTAAQGAGMILEKNDGSVYNTSNTFTLNLITVNDSLIAGTYSGSVTDPLHNTTITITSGTVRALIGKPNPCSSTTPDDNNAEPGPNGVAVYSLDASSGTCSNAQVEGTYTVNSALTAANTVALDVIVTTPGSWSVETSATKGITFSGSGNFTATGVQTIVLTGSGTPAKNGTITMPVTAGTSTCSFNVSVQDEAVAPCTLDSNTASLSGVNTLAFYGVSSLATGGSYTITGNSMTGDLSLEFSGLEQPTPGVYTIQSIAGDFHEKDVRVSFTSSDIYWQSSQGKVYVTVTNGKVTAKFCDVDFSGTLGGPSFTAKGSANITEE